MKSLTLSQVVSILALAFMASIIPACGGGGSSKDAAGSPIPPPPAVSTVGMVHVSTTLAGPINCPVSGNVLLRTVTFVPTNANDIILYVIVEGQYTTVASASPGLYSLDIQDASGASIGALNDDVPNRLPGTNMPFRMTGNPFQSSGNAHFWSEGQFPSASYTLKLYCSTGTTAAISTSNIVVKIVTMEGVQVVSPSGLITG